jgi:hypothetical protein
MEAYKVRKAIRHFSKGAKAMIVKLIKNTGNYYLISS